MNEVQQTLDLALGKKEDRWRKLALRLAARLELAHEILRGHDCLNEELLSAETDYIDEILDVIGIPKENVPDEHDDEYEDEESRDNPDLFFCRDTFWEEHRDMMKPVALDAISESPLEDKIGRAAHLLEKWIIENEEWLLKWNSGGRCV